MPFALESRVKTDEIIGAFGSVHEQRNYFLYIYHRYLLDFKN